MPSTRPTVLVTGATGIIGPAIVETLARAGWQVAATDQTVENLTLCEHLTGRKLPAALFVASDLSTREGTIALVREVEAKLGRLSAIVNAAVVNHGRSLDDLAEAEAHKEMAVNFLAPLWLMQTALDSLRTNRGSIVNFSSIRTVAPRRNSLIYSCTKIALEKATEILAGDLLQDGVRVNAIRIGIVPGNHYLREAARSVSPELAQQMVGELLPRHIERMQESVGAECVGSPGQIARWVAILLDPKNGFLNGETITLDGGYSRKMPSPLGSKTSAEDLDNWRKKHKV